ncbi:hypothetical protein EDD86DRAFT_208811 [Gorgonomyces haynaldii]|nr:hypothetical protein EDD86DRAFT_208811 [Gorgonomyces haynaldii]
MDNADKQIRFLKLDEIKPKIQTGAWMLFFGAHWCVNTARWTPKYLEAQKRVDQEGIKVNMAKIECSADGEQFCTQNFKVDGFPTMLAYIDGQLKEEYPDSDEVEPFVEYLRKLSQEYQLLHPDVQPITEKIQEKPNEKELSKSLDEHLIKSSQPTQQQAHDGFSFSVIAIGSLVVLSAFLIVATRIKRQYRKVDSERDLED